ncbi:MAG TPA: SMP-30/gluconolactonase/LRE family protein [Candidatus Methylomirabilis sp.]|nr:SMP-30/gluconolactonase/LRE family protein [Candidatus Methylomirabilis sp.]HSC71995.1 SMP-30/gluconolactonase/LRE family protein [Candidatus Methylomirabilis sp.]
MRPASRVLPLALLSLTLLVAPAGAWIRSPATTFATLPAGSINPEGITVDAKGNVYVTTFAPSQTPPGHLVVFDHSGHLLRQVEVDGSSNLLLGLAFHPKTGALLVLDLGGAQVLKVNPVTGASTIFATIPGGAAAGPNALTFDGAGNVYVSDSFQGIIWRIGPNGGTPVAWVTSPLLTTAGFPPFGANGLGFNKARTALFVTNTGNDTVVKIPVSNGTAGDPVVFVNSINGADGLILDHEDNLWVAANQADEIVVVNPSGRVIAKLGDFDGIDPHGSPNGLLFPASLVFSGEFLYVTNLSLDLRLFGLPQAVDSQWAAQVTRHTVAKIRARIPPVPGLRR